MSLEDVSKWQSVLDLLFFPRVEEKEAKENQGVRDAGQVIRVSRK